ncbi:MAG: regulatory protein RecX [Clostridiaceae bacterium]|nr:regulatory protein RecX [Clostridiaceae bacterium]
MIITSFEKSKKNKDMIKVFIDGEYSLTISEEDYLLLGLYEKKEVTQEELDLIKTNILMKDVRACAIKYLSLRLLSERELFEKLQLKGYDEEIINEVILDLKSIGYINDMIYARKFVYERLKLKPKSKKMLKMELKNKGIADEISDEVINNLEYDESVAIERLVKKRFGKYNLEDPRIIRKIYSFLLHRGFDYENIKAILKSI